jgi:ribosome-associated protein
MSERPSAAPRIVNVRAVPIELCQLLKFGGLAATGGEAKAVISAGKVLLNGAVETQKRKKLQPGDRVTCDGQTLEVRVV